MNKPITFKLRTLLISLGVIVLLSFAFGRWSTPKRTEIKEKEKSSKEHVEQHEKDTDFEVIKIKRPDGTTIEKRVRKTKDKSKEVDKEKKSKEKSTLVITNGSKTFINVMIGKSLSNFTTSPLSYGLHVGTSLIGPINIGVYGTTEKTVGITLGVSF